MSGFLWNMPFDTQGLKDSGIGSQGVTNSISMMTKIKTTVINLPSPSYTMGWWLIPTIGNNNTSQACFSWVSAAAGIVNIFCLFSSLECQLQDEYKSLYPLVVCTVIT